MASETYDEGPSKVATEIKRTLRILIATTVVLFLALLGMGIYVYGISRDNTRALCATKLEAQRRVAETEKFIKETPNGIPGLSPAVLQRSLDASKSTVKSLDAVSCPAPPPIPPDGTP